MAKHVYTARDLAELRAAALLIEGVRNRVETDADALDNLDGLIFPIQDFIEGNKR